MLFLEGKSPSLAQKEIRKIQNSNGFENFRHITNVLFLIGIFPFWIARRPFAFYYFYVLKSSFASRYYLSIQLATGQTRADESLFLQTDALICLNLPLHLVPDFFLLEHMPSRSKSKI